jgi:hypothetical protein
MENRPWKTPPLLRVSHRTFRIGQHSSTHTNQKTSLRPLRPLCEPQYISHWTTFIGPHQPKNISAPAASSVRATVYFALDNIHRPTPTKKHLCARCVLRVSHSVFHNGQYSSAHTNQKTSPRPLRPLCEPQYISHWTTFIDPHQPKNISAPAASSVRDIRRRKYEA